MPLLSFEVKAEFLPPFDFGLEFLQSKADIFENFALNAVGKSGMVFDLVNGSEAKIRGCYGFLCSWRQHSDRHEEVLSDCL